MLNSSLLANSIVLVVDDQLTSRTIMSQIIRGMSAKIDIIEKDSPEEALVWAENNTADLVIFDYIMPKMNGINFIEKIKEIDRYKDVPSLMVTIKNNDETHSAALDSGVTDFLSKPIDINEYLTRCKNLLTMRMQHVALQAKSKFLEQRIQEASAAVVTREKETLKVLGRVGKHKDSDTSIRLKRMSLYSRAIAKATGFNEADQEIMELAAPLHDLGKIGIPDSILLKKGPLTEEEMDIIKTHTQMGYDILDGSTSQYLNMGGKIALNHHERFDGSGYPTGISGKDIPLEARIVAIADVLDALTSIRPYKRTWSFEDAFDYLIEESNKHFDPDLIKITISIREELENIHVTYSSESLDNKNQKIA